MTTIPTVTTARLVMRPFREDDVPAVERLLSTPHVAQQTLNFAYPYPPGAALDWIRRHSLWAERGLHLQWAITLPHDEPIGTISIALRDEPPHGDVGYWIGVDHWNRGYATEATRAVIAYCFEALRLPRIIASCFVGNDASARVLEKAGMTEEWLLPGQAVKDGVPRDLRWFVISARPGPL